MDIFEIILSPFVYIIEHIFMLSYGITSNYGGAIVLLSFIISIFLLPIFIFIEKAKKKDDIIKQRMKSQLDEIKRSYKGQERYYYIKTLNRQHNYSPTRALIPILSLLIQIPFFIAAYQFLEAYSPLIKQSFLVIADLSKADALFGSINLLPILMTIVNLITVYFYTINSDDKKERNQMLVVAAVFLIMLFNLPAGLLLYWTMNNAFSFLRLFITNPEVFAKKKSDNPKLKFIDLKNRFIFYISFLILLAFQINWALKYNFDDFIARAFLSLIISLSIYYTYFFVDKYAKQINNKIHEIGKNPNIYFSLLFFTIYFQLSSLLYFDSVNNTLAIIGLIVLIPLEFISIYIFINSGFKSNKKKVFGFLALLLITFQIINVVSLLKGGNISIKIPNISAFGLLLTLILAFYNKAFSRINIPKIDKGYLIFSLSILYFFGQIFLWGPLLSFASFPEAFEFGAFDIAKNNIPILLIILAAFIITFKFLGNKTKGIAIISASCILIIAFVNSTLFPQDLGTLQLNKFSEERNLAAPILNYFIESIFILSTILFVNWAFKKKYFKQIVLALILINAVIISQSLHSISELDSNKDKELSDANGTISKKIDGETIINFSKTKKNVILLMPDMFQGIAMENIINDSPETIENFTGFTWYRNTLSISRVTNSSMPSLMGGFDYLPNILDKDTSHTIREKMTSAMKSVITKAQDRGFDITMTKFPYTEMEEMEYDVLLPRWHKEWNNYNTELGINSVKSDNSDLLIESAFLYSSPLVAKAAIYNKGNWTKSYFIKTGINENSWIAKSYNFLRLLPHISTTQNDKSNFILLYSFVTHFPWNYVDKTGEIHKDVSPITTNKWTLETFAEWIKWMKDNNVYDNTMIIIVSDHGVPWHRYEGEIEIDFPFKNINEDLISKEFMMTLNPVLLVKDFGQKGDMQIDNRFMSNVDVNSIIFDDVNVTNSPIDPDRKLTSFISWWVENIDKSNQYAYKTSYEVKNNIFDANNWREVKKKGKKN